MADEPLFDLELLGYRNDLARERALVQLRQLGGAVAGALDRDTALPLRLDAGLTHAEGLRLLGRLRDSGAHVRLVAAAGTAEPRVDAPPPSTAPPRTRAGLGLVPGVLLVGLLAAIALQALPRLRPLQPPAAGIPLPLDGGAGAAAATRHLNDEAVALNAAGSYQAAADRLRSAVADAPSEAALRRNLRTVLRNGAVAALNADRPGDAVPLLEEALAIDEDAALLSALGIARVREGDAAAGREALERATAMGATDAATLMALGTAYRQLGRRAEAVDTLHRAREAGARGPDFDALLTRAERELDAEWDFDETRSAHFTIGFAGGESDSREAADLVVRGLESAYFGVGSKLDVYPDERLPVVLYPSEDFHDVTQTPSWSAGVYDGRIKLPVGGLLASDEAVLTRTLRHEYGHVLVHQLARDRAPVWLNEGVAIWSEEERDGDRTDWALQAIAGQPLFRLGELAGAFTVLPAERVRTAYAQSYLAVRALVARHGNRRVRALLEQLGAGVPFDRAFRDSLSTDPAAFEQELLRQLTG